MHLVPSCPGSFQYMRIHPLTEEGTAASKAKLSALRAADDVRRETAQAKNDLESYILKVINLFSTRYSVWSWNTFQQGVQGIMLATKTGFVHGVCIAKVEI